MKSSLAEIAPVWTVPSPRPVPGIERFREMERHWYRAWTLIVLAQVESQQGQYCRRSRYFEESPELSREINDKWLIPWSLEGLAGVIATQGEAAQAARLWGAAEALRENYSFPMPPIEYSSYEQAVTSVRCELGEEAFATAWSQERTTPLEQVIYDVLKMRIRQRSDKVVPTQESDL